MAKFPSIPTILKRGLLLGLLLFVLLVLVLAGVWIYIAQKPDFLTVYKEDFQAILADFSVNLDYETVYLEPLHKIEIRNLDLKWEGGEGLGVSVKSPLLRIQYQGGKLLAKYLIIEEFLFQEPDISVTISQVSKSKVDEKPAEGKPISLEEIGDLLAHPPIKIAVNKVKIDHGRIRVRITDPELQGSVNISEFSVDHTLNWISSKLDGTGHIFFKQSDQEALHLSIGPDGSQKKVSLNPQLDIKYDFSADPRELIKDAQFNLSKLKGEFKHKIDLGPIRFTDAASDLKVALSSLSQIIEITPQKENIFISHNTSLQGLSSRLLKRDIEEISLTNHLNFPLDLASLEGDMKLGLASQDLLKWSFHLLNQTRQLTVNHKINLDLRKSLSQYLKEAEILERMGRIQGEIIGDHTLNHQWDNGLAIDFAKIKEQDLSSTTNINITQSEIQAQKALFRLSKPLVFLINHKYENQVLFQDFNLKAEALGLKELASELNLNMRGKQEVPIDLAYLKNNIAINLEDKNLLEVNQEIDDSENTFSLKQNLSMNVDPRLKKYLKELQALDQVGSNLIQSELNLSLRHDKESILVEDAVALYKNQVNIHHNLAVQQVQAPSKDFQNAVILHKPFELNTKGELKQNSLKLDVNGQAADLAIQDLVRTKGFSFSLASEPFEELFLENNQLNTPKDAKLYVKLNNDQVELKDSSIDLKEELKDISLSFLASVKDMTRVNLSQFLLKVGPKLMTFTMVTEAELKPVKFKSEGQLSLELPDIVLNGQRLESKGHMDLPFSIFLNTKRMLAMRSSLRFHDMAIQYEDMALKNLDGSINLDESINIDTNNKFRFTRLLEKNPFQRVDFNAIQPYLIDDTNLRFQSLRWKNLELGPFVGRIDIEQNLFNIPYFSLGLFGGDLNGEFLLDTHPDSLKVGLLARFTNIDPGKMVTEGKAAQQSFEETKISGSVNFIFDIRKRLIEGRFSITEIGSLQLLRLIDVIDPDFEDDDLNTLRQLLAIGYPERVIVNMQEGLMDIGVDVMAAGISKHQDIFAVPLSPIIESNIGELIAQALEQYDKLYPVSTDR